MAAIRAAQLGKKVAIIEKYPTLGGTCLNVGCIPSKALLDSSEHFHNARQHFAIHGIKFQKLALDFKQMIARKTQLVSQICQGVAFLMKKNKITTYTGTANFENNRKICILHKQKKEYIEGKNIIIATGSKPSTLPFISLDKKRVITSTEALSLTEVPKNLLIIGGGVIGLELGSVYARLGAKVSVIEYLDRLIPTMDETMSRELQKVLIKLGFQCYTSHKVSEVKRVKHEVQVQATNSSGKKLTLKGDYCLVSVGRRPYTEDLGLR